LAWCRSLEQAGRSGGEGGAQIPVLAGVVGVGGMEAVFEGPGIDRAAGIVEARGRSARTLRYLAARGFAEGSLEDLIAELGDRALR